MTRASSALRASLEQNLQTRLPRSLVRLGLDIDKAESRPRIVDAVDEFFVPLVEVNVSTGEVKLGLFVKPAQWTAREGSDTSTAAAAKAPMQPGEAAILGQELAARRTRRTRQHPKPRPMSHRAL